MNGRNTSGENMLQLEMSMVHSTSIFKKCSTEYICVSMTYLPIGATPRTKTK